MRPVAEGTRGGSLLRLFGPAVIASFSASILGFIFWVAAARLYTPVQVGVTGSTISLISGIGTAAAGGLYAVLLRVLPVHETPRRLLWVASAATMVFAAIMGLAVGILHLSRLPVSLLWLMIPLAASVWSLFALQDSILLSLRKTRVLFLSNVGFGLAKLLLLVAFAGTALGIAGAWLIPLLLVVPIVALVADRALASATPTEATTMKVTARHVFAEYWNSFAVVFSIAGVPIVATLVVGGTFSGLVYVCWTVYTASDMTSTWLSNAMVVTATEQSFDVSRAVRHGRSIIPAMMGASLLAIVLAPLILAVFGSRYAAALPCCACSSSPSPFESSSGWRWLAGGSRSITGASLEDRARTPSWWWGGRCSLPDPTASSASAWPSSSQQRSNCLPRSLRGWCVGCGARSRCPRRERLLDQLA